MNILSEQPLRRTSVVDSSKIRPLNVINELSKSLVQYHFHSWWLHRTYLSTKFVFHWFGLHIKKVHLTTELVRLAVFLQTILSRWSPRVCRSSNLTYIFIHQQGHGNVLYWTEVITVRNTRQPGLVDRTSVCICVITTVLCKARVAIKKKLNRVLLICVCWLLMRELFVVSSLGTSAWFG